MIDNKFNAYEDAIRDGGISMKTTEELLYQIRGLARMVVAFSVGVSGLVALWPNAASSWLPHLVGLAEIGLALWLLIAFTSKTPLWLTGAALIVLLLDTLWVAPSVQGLVLTVALPPTTVPPVGKIVASALTVWAYTMPNWVRPMPATAKRRASSTEARLIRSKR